VPQAIDWLYARKSCETCKKAAAHCSGLGIVAKETVDASKVKLDRSAVTALLTTVSKVVAARGQAVVEFGLKTADPEAVLAHVMGPTGNLRAPTARVGKTLLVGFRPEMYDAVFNKAG
jgi:arsenate reductase-like glutaredoxin family protein